MTCQQIKRQFEAVSDPAADICTRMQVESHLSECPGCAHAFTELHELDESLHSILRRGSRTPALWNPIEAMISEEAKLSAPEGRRKEDPDLTPWQLLRLAAERWLAATSLSARAAWGCLAATWIVILLLNMTSHTSDIQPGTAAAIASNSEAGVPATRQHLMAVEVAAFSEPVESPRDDRPGPRTQLTMERRSA
jgi:anti-sigma factor RsiW